MKPDLVKHSKGDGWCIICGWRCVLAPTHEQRMEALREGIRASVRRAFELLKTPLAP